MTECVITLFGEPEATVDGELVGLGPAWPFLSVLLLWRQPRPIRMGDVVDMLTRPESLADDPGARFRKHRRIVQTALKLELPQGRALAEIAGAILACAEVDVALFDEKIESADGEQVREAIQIRRRGPLLAGWKALDIIEKERAVREKKYQNALWRLIQEDRHTRPEDALCFIEMLSETEGLPPARVEVLQEMKLTLEHELLREEEAAPVVVARPSRILRPITSFVGREQEKQHIKTSLTMERLVTLVGMGGCGKTRLALEIAADMEKAGEYGVWPIELASLRDPTLLPQTVARTLGLEVNTDFVEAAIAYLLVQEKPTLLLDNCEHLIQASADLVETLLQACPNLQVLATSRKPLNIDGEHLCRLQPLPFPDPATLRADAPDSLAALLAYDAVRLFVDRALQFREFTLGPENVGPIAAICTLLDGIPLALELAAARFKALSLDEIAERLSDRFGLLISGRHKSPARHKTLRAVIDWSYDLLTEPERALLCRLSVFAGGWTLDAAEAVGSSEDLPPTAVLDLLEGLVDNSLVVADLMDAPGRFRMLETVRQYAQADLRERGGWEATHSKHRDYFLALAEEAETSLRGPEQKEWLDRLEAQIDNLRAALSWCLEPDAEKQAGGNETGLRLAGALRVFWDMHGYFSEGRRWLETAIERGGAAASPAVQAKAFGALGPLIAYLGEHEAATALLERSLALHRQLGDNDEEGISLNNLGLVALFQGHYPAAKALFQEGLRLRRQIDDKHGSAKTLNNLGQVAAEQGRLDEARELYQESLTLHRRIGDKNGIAMSLNNLANLGYHQGDYETAKAVFEESLALSRVIGHTRVIASTLCNLGGVAHGLGDDQAATAYLKESLMLRRQIGETRGTADTLNNLADIALHQRDYTAAWKLYEESLTLRRRIGNKQNIAYSLHNLGEVADGQGRTAEADALFRESLTLMREIEDEYGIAFSLEGLASVAALSGRASAAARLWGAAESLREANGTPRPANTQEEYQSKVAAVRVSLGDAALASVWAEGRTLTWKQAVSLALGESAS